MPSDPQHNARDMRHRIDSFFECCNCGAAHLAMDPRINSLHHRHLEYLRRRAYNAEGVRRRESLARASSRMLLLAAVSLFIGELPWLVWHVIAGF